MPDSIGDTVSNLTVIGFDLGHGETALASTRLATTDEPRAMTINGARTIPTLVGRHKDGRILFGVTAGRHAGDLIEAYERFKSPDSVRGNDRAAQATRMFVSEIVRSLQSDRQIDDIGRTHVFVGHPSGWSPQVVEDYRALLMQSGLPVVDVVPESRAAFVHARESGELNLSMDELSRKVLIMDFGSSTTDFTAALGLATQPLDFGDIALGAGIIDGILMQRMIDRSASPAVLHAALDRMPGKKSELALACRKAKEDFFNAEKTDPAAVIQAYVRVDVGLAVEIDVDRREIETVLSQPTDLLGGMSWRQALNDCLTRVRRMVDDPDLIILTGGAARMGFIREEVVRMFPGTRLAMSQEPELSIAKGLALYGRLLIKTRSYGREIETLLSGTAFRTVVDDGVPNLIGRQAEAIAVSLAQGPVRSVIGAWRDEPDRVSTVNDMGALIAQECEAWVRGPEARQVMTKVVADWLEENRLKFEMLTDPFCERYGIPRRALSLRGHVLTRLTAGNAATPDVLGDVTVVQTIAAAIASILAANLLVAVHILMGSHPVGWAIAIIGSIAGAFFGVEEAKRLLQGVHIPGFTRKWLLSDAKLDKLVTEASNRMSGQLNQALEKAESSGSEADRLSTRLREQIGDAIRQRADDAILLLK